jgi:hypothetical protein
MAVVFSSRAPSRRLARSFSTLGTIAALISSVSSVHAAEPSPADEPSSEEADSLSAARAKFQRALELKEAGQYGEALKLLREVGQVKMTPQVRYHIATCEAGLGQLVTALGGYEIAFSQITPDMPPAFASEVQDSIDKLRARIPKLVLERGPGAEGARIELDQVRLGPNAVGREVPVDPGPHHIVASASGFLPYDRTVDLGEGQRVVVRIDLTPAPVAEKEPSRTGPRYGAWPFVLGGVGVLGLAAGAVLLPVSQDKASQAQDLCGGTDCTHLQDPAWSQAHGLASDALTLETAGWIAGGVGAGLLATGVVLFLIDPGRKSAEAPAAAGVSFVPSAPNGLAGGSLVGSFCGAPQKPASYFQASDDLPDLPGFGAAFVVVVVVGAAFVVVLDVGFREPLAAAVVDFGGSDGGAVSIGAGAASVDVAAEAVAGALGAAAGVGSTATTAAGRAGAGVAATVGLRKSATLPSAKAVNATAPIATVRSAVRRLRVFQSAVSLVAVSEPMLARPSVTWLIESDAAQSPPSTALSTRWMASSTRRRCSLRNSAKRLRTNAPTSASEPTRKWDGNASKARNISSADA